MLAYKLMKKPNISIEDTRHLWLRSVAVATFLWSRSGLPPTVLYNLSYLQLQLQLVSVYFPTN